MIAAISIIYRSGGIVGPASAVAKLDMLFMSGLEDEKRDGISGS